MSDKYQDENERDHMDGHEEIDGDEHDHHHDMTGEGPSTQEADDAAEKKKKKDKLFKVAVIGVAVLVGGGLAANKLLSSPTPAAKRSPFDTPASSSKNGSSNAQQAQDQQAQAVLGGSQPAPLAPSSATLDQTAPVADPVVVAAPGSEATVDHTVADPGAVSATPVATVDTTAPVAVSAPATAPVAAPVAVLATPSGSDPTLNELSQKMDAIGEALRNFDGAKIETRLMSLEERMSALESGKKAPHAASEVKATPRAEKRVSRAARQASKPSKPTASAKKSEKPRDNTLFDENTKSVAAKEERSESVRTRRDFTLQAVIPGRMWIKRDDGTSHSFAVGEKLPDGSKVLKIEAERNRVQTSSGSLQ